MQIKMIILIALLLNFSSCKTDKPERVYGNPKSIMEIKEEISKNRNSRIDSTKYFYSDSKLERKVNYLLSNIVKYSEYDNSENLILIKNCIKNSNCSEIRYYYDKDNRVKAEIFSDKYLDYYILYSYDKKNKKKYLSYYYSDSSIFKEEILNYDEMPLVRKEYYKDSAIVRSVKNYDFEQNMIVEQIYSRSGKLIHTDSTTNLISRKLMLMYNPKLSKIMNNSKMIKDLTFDNEGNWILREIYELDKLKFRITRKIEY